MQSFGNIKYLPSNRMDKASHPNCCDSHRNDQLSNDAMMTDNYSKDICMATHTQYA